MHGHMNVKLVNLVTHYYHRLLGFLRPVAFNKRVSKSWLFLGLYSAQHSFNSVKSFGSFLPPSDVVSTQVL